MENIGLQKTNMCPGQMSQKVLLSFILSLMATKDTPKKLVYKSAAGTNLSNSSCRLCKAVVDRKHCRDLYKSSNRTILKNAEEIYGNVLPQDKNLPHLICRPCERRLDNTIQFKNIIAQTQKTLEEDSRTKCCLEISPSVIKPPSKVLASGSSSSGRRRSLDFTETFPAALEVSPIRLHSIILAIK